MACGCTESGCACVVTGGGTVTVSGAGTVENPFVVSSSASPTFAATNPSGGIDITPAGTLGHTPAFELVIDPASTAPVTVSEDGLRVDCCEETGLSPIQLVDEDTTLTDDMQVVLVDVVTAGADVDLLLPAIVVDGKRFEVKYYHGDLSFNIYLDGNGNDIDGSGTPYQVGVLGGSSITVIGFDNEWHTLA